MLRHSVQFLNHYRYLGLVSEAPLESFHAQFNNRFHSHHYNLGRDISERLRRSLADTTLSTIQPLL